MYKGVYAIFLFFQFLGFLFLGFLIFYGFLIFRATGSIGERYEHLHHCA